MAAVAFKKRIENMLKIKSYWPGLYTRPLLLIFFAFIIITLQSCNSESNPESKIKSFANTKKIKILITDNNDSFLTLRKIDYDIDSNSLYGIYSGMNRNMNYFFYKISLQPQSSLELYGEKGQGPDKFKYPADCVRVFNSFVMVASGNSIKIFDKEGNFIKNIDNLPFNIEDFNFDNGKLILLRKIWSPSLIKENEPYFVEYDISNNKKTKSIPFKTIYNGFKKNNIDLIKLKKPTWLNGRVINSHTAVLFIVTNSFNRNGFLILDVEKNKTIFCKAKQCFKNSVFILPGIFPSSCNKNCFFVVEQQLGQAFLKGAKGRNLTEEVLKRNKPPLICIHRMDIDGKEINSYLFDWYQKGMVNIMFLDLIETKPEQFAIFATINLKNEKKHTLYRKKALLLWNARAFRKQN